MPSTLPFAAHSAASPPALFVVMDPGRDPDDEDVLVLLAYFVRAGLVDLRGIVANLRPSLDRARLVRGTCDALGLEAVPVGVGSDPSPDAGPSYEFDVPYLADAFRIENGAALLLRVLEDVPSGGLTLVLLSQLGDAAAVFAAHPRLFAAKVRRVVVMGGVEVEDGRPVVDAAGRLLPDLDAQNHAFDPSAATAFYRVVQDAGIPLTVVARYAAEAAKLPRAVYDVLGATAHPVGIRLRDVRRASIRHLWTRANLAAHDPARAGLPPRCDRTWFCTTFCGGRGLGRGASDDVWDIVRAFVLYDPCALLAALPWIADRHFAPHLHGAGHRVIGLGPERSGVAHPDALSALLATLLIDGLVPDR